MIWTHYLHGDFLNWEHKSLWKKLHKIFTHLAHCILKERCSRIKKWINECTCRCTSPDPGSKEMGHLTPTVEKCLTRAKILFTKGLGRGRNGILRLATTESFDILRSEITRGRGCLWTQIHGCVDRAAWQSCCPHWTGKPAHRNPVKGVWVTNTLILLFPTFLTSACIFNGGTKSEGRGQGNHPGHRSKWEVRAVDMGRKEIFSVHRQNAFSLKVYSSTHHANQIILKRLKKISSEPLTVLTSGNESG